MAKTKKTATTTKTSKPRKGSKGTKAPEPAKPAPATSKAPDLAAQEQAIIEKYPDLQVKTGSLRYDEAQQKKVLVIYCNYCQKPREIFSQDAFQVRQCGSPECRKAHKKGKQ